MKPFRSPFRPFIFFFFFSVSLHSTYFTVFFLPLLLFYFTFFYLLPMGNVAVVPESPCSLCSSLLFFISFLFFSFHFISLPTYRVCTDSTQQSSQHIPSHPQKSHTKKKIKNFIFPPKFYVSYRKFNDEMFFFFPDYVYFETSSTSPYQIRRIEELNKVKNTNK